MNRRETIKVVLAPVLLRLIGAGAYAGTLFLAGCGFSIDTILSYVSIAVKALNAVVQVLAQLGITVFPGGALVTVVVQAVSAALTAISTAVTAYDNAPAADKASTKLKITLAIYEAIGQLQTFWTNLGIQNATVQAIITVIIATLQGFLPQLPVPPNAAALNARMSSSGLTPVPKTYKAPEDFQTEINKILVDGGYAKLAIQ
jgi:hypothetical protein